jgi:y4mF family transcriptional regulator
MRIIAWGEMSKVGDALRAERERQGLTQNDLAALADVGVVTIYNVEQGKQTIRADALGRVARALGLELGIVRDDAARGAVPLSKEVVDGD